MGGGAARGCGTRLDRGARVRLELDSRAYHDGHGARGAATAQLFYLVGPARARAGGFRVYVPALCNTYARAGILAGQ